MLELRRYLSIARRRLWLLVALVIVGGVLGDLATSHKVVYSSTSTIYIGSSSYAPDTPSGVQAGADQQLLTTRLIPTYAQMLQSQPIAADAATRAGFNQTTTSVLSHIKVANQPNTTLLTVTATEPSAPVAQTIANAVADSFATKIQTLQPKGGQGAVPTAPAYVFQRARLPGAPLPVHATGNILKGAAVGLVVALGIAGLLEYLDITIKGPKEAEERLDLPVLGVIPLRRTDA